MLKKNENQQDTLNMKYTLYY